MLKLMLKLALKLMPMLRRTFHMQLPRFVRMFLMVLYPNAAAHTRIFWPAFEL